jgi:hypothetical protein
LKRILFNGLIDISQYQKLNMARFQYFDYRMAIDTKNDLWKQVLAEIFAGFKVTHFYSM